MSEAATQLFDRLMVALWFRGIEQYNEGAVLEMIDEALAAHVEAKDRRIAELEAALKQSQDYAWSVLRAVQLADGEISDLVMEDTRHGSGRGQGYILGSIAGLRLARNVYGKRIKEVSE